MVFFFVRCCKRCGDLILPITDMPPTSPLIPLRFFTFPSLSPYCPEFVFSETLVYSSPSFQMDLKLACQAIFAIFVTLFVWPVI